MTDEQVKKEGIESLKRAITYIGTQARGIFGIDANKDGSIDPTEIFSYTIALLPTIPGIIPVFGKVLPEASDLDKEEFDQLIDHVLNTDFLPDDKDRAEGYVKAVITWLNMNRRFTEYNIAFFNGEDVSYNPNKVSA